MAQYDLKEAIRIAKQARDEYQAGLMYRHDREKQWQLIEDFYFNRVKKSLKGKFNVPVPILPGFVDTWQAEMARHVTLKFEQQESADYKAAKKTTAFYNAIKNKDDYDWDMADTDGKKLACLSGRNINKYFAQSKPSYKSTLLLVDHYDFIASPTGGGDLERHLFVQEDNIFKGKEELKEGVAQGIYIRENVEKLINATKQDTIVDNDNIYKSKQNRLIALGMNGITYNYAGQALYKFIEAGTTWKGKRYYVLFNYETGLPIRCQPLVEVFESNLWWFTSWATHRDTFNFWSKGPCDDMVPMAEMIRILVNQEFDNRNKINYKQRAYDPEIFPDPAKLEWRPDGLVEANRGLGTKKIGDGIYEFQTNEFSGTINLVNWIDNMLKEKTGVNSEAQGQSDQDKVGIAYLNVQQSAKRTALVYESYTKCWQGIGRRFLWGLKEHMRKPLAVKIIGEQGEEWEDLARTEINPEWDIRVEGGQEEANQDEIKKKSLKDMLDTVQPDELAVTSPKWRVKVKLQAIGIDDDDIRSAFDLEGEYNKEILSEASKMIQDVLQGKIVKPFRGATPAFCQKIVDYATDNDLEMADYQALMALAEQHLPIATENMARKAVQMAAQAGMPIGQPQSATEQLYGQPDQPAPNTPGGTQSRSQGMTNLAPRV
jgi:hypothetical protein